jgi:hypothetical protein
MVMMITAMMAVVRTTGIKMSTRLKGGIAVSKSRASARLCDSADMLGGY